MYLSNPLISNTNYHSRLSTNMISANNYKTMLSTISIILNFSVIQDKLDALLYDQVKLRIPNVAIFIHDCNHKVQLRLL